MFATATNRAVQSRLNSYARFASLASAAIGVAVLLGWLLNLQALKSILPGLASMKANTAVCTILVAAAVLLLGGHSLRFDKVQSRVAGTFCAVSAGLLGFATLCEYLFGWNLRIDEFLFRDAVPDGHSVAGRMAPNTAVAFLVLAVALLLISVETRRGLRPAQLLAIFPAILSLTAIAGYVFSVVSLYRVVSYTGMAMHTSTVVFLMSVAVILTPPDRGIAAIVSTDGLGGVVVRRLLPAALFVPFTIGWIRMEGQKAGLYGTAFGLGIMVTTNVFVFSVLIYLCATQVQRLADARQLAEQGVLELNYTLKALVDAFPLPVIMLSAEARVRTWNAAAERVFGWSWLQVRGKPNPLVPIDKVAEFQSILELLKAGDSVTGVETVLCTRDDVRVPVLLWAAPIEIGKHGFSGSILIFDDRTGRNDRDGSQGWPGPAGVAKAGQLI